MPRKSIDARKKILESLIEKPKTWAELLKDTRLSKASLSKHINELIENLVIITSADTTSRPPITVYALNQKATQLRRAKPLYQIQNVKPEKTDMKLPVMTDIRELVLKNPQRLDELLRLNIISSIWGLSDYVVAVSTDTDFDTNSILNLFKDKPASLSIEDVNSVCMERLVRSVQGLFKLGYKIAISKEKIIQEIEKVRQEGFFDIGQKSHFGIRVTKKLASYYLGWDEDIGKFFNESEGYTRFSRLKTPGRSWREDFGRLLFGARKTGEL